MNTSVGMKSRKNQSSLSAVTPEGDRRLERTLLSLENTCLRILQSRLAGSKQYSDHLYWQQRLKNITTPVSLALAEYKGPRHFHNHYRHKPDDETILQPVLEPAPIDMLAQVCEQALTRCQHELVGVHDAEIIDACDSLERMLRRFLTCYTKVN